MANIIVKGIDSVTGQEKVLSASDSLSGQIKLATDLGNTVDNPNVIGLRGQALPSNIVDGFLKRNVANTAWEFVAYGNVSNSVAQGNDNRFLSVIDRVQRVLMSQLVPGSATFALISGTAYFVYLGKIVSSITPKYVEFHVSTAGAGAQTAEVGLFSSPNAPSKVGQSLTKIVSTATVDVLTSTGVKRNTSAFNTNVVAGTHLWAGIRTVMATTQPSIWGFGLDMAQGSILRTTSAAVFANAGPWTGAIVAAATAMASPDLRVTLD